MSKVKKFLSPGSGVGLNPLNINSAKVIRLQRQGCTNRPFYHIVVAEKRKHQYRPSVEQVGIYDPMPNRFNEKVISLNFERIKHWIGNGATMSLPVEQLLGLSGFFPIHPTSYMAAWRNRQLIEIEEKKKMEEESNKEQKPDLEKAEASSS